MNYKLAATGKMKSVKVVMQGEPCLQQITGNASRFNPSSQEEFQVSYPINLMIRHQTLFGCYISINNATLLNC